MNQPRVGFIGFGEAGFHIARGLTEAGLQNIAAFDINTNTPGFGERIKQRATESSTLLVESSSELAHSASILFSTVTASSAAEAAAQTAPFLTVEHLYADLNSVSPSSKQEIERIVRSTGARFVEAAVMAPVPPYHHKVPMLLTGDFASELIGLMAPYEMKLEEIEGGTGAASAVKMCRSIVVKGMEALIFECLLGASRYGAEQRVFASLAESFPGLDWERLADYMIGRVVVHGERRAREMEQVAETLRAAGVQPRMSEATARLQDWSAKIGLREKFGGNAPSSWSEVMKELNRK